MGWEKQYKRRMTKIIVIFFFWIRGCTLTVFNSHGGTYNKINWATSRQNQQNGMCAKRRLRSARAPTQSDKSLRCPHEASFGPDQTGRMPESSLGAHSICWFCHEAAQFNPLTPSELFYPYKLDECFFLLRGVWLSFFSHFNATLTEIPVYK